MLDEAFHQIEPLLGTQAACAAVGRARATHYRRLRPGRTTERTPRPAPANKLSDDEVDVVLEALRSERFADCSPAQVYFTLLDEGVYLASESSYYRILRSHNEVCERAPSESGELAKEHIADAVERHQVPPDQLTIHADRGSSMTSNPVTELLTFLGIGRSHSRPHVSNDNPYSESEFKTLKYCPAVPHPPRVPDAHGRPPPELVSDRRQELATLTQASPVLSVVCSGNFVAQVAKRHVQQGPQFPGLFIAQSKVHNKSFLTTTRPDCRRMSDSLLGVVLRFCLLGPHLLAPHSGSG